jgi:hypothetical protein
MAGIFANRTLDPDSRLTLGRSDLVPAGTSFPQSLGYHPFALGQKLASSLLTVGLGVEVWQVEEVQQLAVAVP